MNVVKCFLLLMVLFGAFPLSALSQTEDQLGFISIDCGILHAYNHTSLGIYYVPDSSSIDTGENHNISSKINADSVPNRFLTLRSFPDGEKSCYVLKPRQGKNNKYLIRAGFMYGNYDNKSDVPRFDLYLGVNWWDTVALDDASSYWYTEIIYIADSDIINVCLVNTGFGTPFISVLELRLLDNDTYVSPYRALRRYRRVDYGSDSDYVVRFPNDVYDRIWSSWYDDRYELVNTSLSIESVTDRNSYKVPSVVMETAEVPNVSYSIDLYFTRDDSTNQFYVYLYFAEVKELKANEFREFYIYRNEEFWAGPIVPKYLQTIAVHSNSSTLDTDFDVSIVSSENSSLPPLLNAYEAYYVKEFLQSETYRQDVNAIMDIKSTYSLTKYWQGDPCGPDIAVWQGLNCSYNKYDPPRIISLNLSSSGLKGLISPSIAKLTMLKYLDLSNNSLTGPIPDFLTRLKYLTVLNLAQNELSGPIPKELTDKLHSGLLSMSVRNKKNCSSYICKHKVVVPLIATIAVFLVILTTLTIYWSMNRRNQAANAGCINSSSHDGAHRSKERQLFAYSEVVNITKNMDRVIGNGNFGMVYHGRLDDIPVAVKIFYPSYANAYKQFQANARLITRVHHRQLTACFGYFDDSNHKGLIYEFMPNGSLEDILSGRNSNLLSWQERLQIAMDIAQGLHYLHNSCKPPIIHGNLKPTNVLLNEKNQSKLVDFGLSAMFTTETGSTQYVDPEYYVTNKFTERSDVYSFGVVFLSIITNQSATTNTGDINQRVKSLVEKGDIRNVVDPRLKGDDFYIDAVWKAVEIALACASPISARRPPIKLVVMELNQCLAMEISRISRTTGTIEMVTVNLGPGVIPQPR